MSNRSTSARLRLAATSLGAAGLAGVLFASGLLGPGIQNTAAQQTDTEVAKASINAVWATGGWARSSTNAYTNHASYPDRTTGIWPGPVDPVLAQAIRQFTVTSAASPQQLTGTEGNINLDGLAPNFEVRTPEPRPNTGVTFCVQAAPATQLAGIQNGCTNSGVGSPQYTRTDSQTRAKGWGRSGGYANGSRATGQPIVWIETDHATTMAECAPDGSATAAIPTTSFPGKGASVGIVTSFTTSVGTSLSTPAERYSAIEPEVNKRISAWVRPQYRSAIGSWEQGPNYLHVTLTSRAYSTTGYALSDLYMTIDQYSVSSDRNYIGSFTMVFSRSECGITMPGLDHRPLATEFETPNPPAYPTNPGAIPISVTNAPLPLQDGSLAYPGQSDYPATSELGGEAIQVFAIQRLSDEVLEAAELPPMTTVTSPLENTTASETTTSAPPNPDAPENAGESDDGSRSATSSPPNSNLESSTTTTSNSATTSATTSRPSATATRSTSVTATPPATSTAASPAIVIPDEPGTLASNARLEDVETITVDEEELDVVVVKGEEFPSDAKRGAQALEIWLGGGNAGTAWETFASDDPDDDGWRWAAINQKTGTVVYIR